MQLDRQTLLDAFKRMVAIRKFEECVEADSIAGIIPGFVHLYAGQEASAVGVCIHLNKHDWITSTHRGHGHAIAKGCDIKGMMLEIHGKSGGICQGKGGSMHIADFDVGMLGANGIVGGGPPLAVGAALSSKVLRNGGVSVSFFGDGAANQGTTAEALNMAVVLQVPVVFVLENNGYGEFTSTSYHCAGVDLAQRAAGFGLETMKVDGSDFFAVHAAANELISHARNKGMPSLLEVNAKRWYGHFVGDPEPYRSAEEIAETRLKDPIKIFRTRVSEAGLIEDSEFDRIEAEVSNLIESSSRSAIEAASPPLSALTSNVYFSY